MKTKTKTKKSKKLVVRIPRTKWLAPNKRNINGFSTLYNSNVDAACCLGHVIHTKSRCSWNDLDDLGLPAEYHRRADGILVKKDGVSSIDNTVLSEEASKINDALGLTRKEKEKALVRLFSKHNIKLEFYGPEREDMLGEEYVKR